MLCIGGRAFFEFFVFPLIVALEKGFFFTWTKTASPYKFNLTLKCLNTNFRGKTTSDIITI